MSTTTAQSLGTLDLKGFLPDLVDVIAAAHDLGWHSTQKAHSGRGHYPTVVLHSPIGDQTIRIDAVRQMNENKLEALRRKVVTYGDSTKKALALAGKGLPSVTAVADGLAPVIPNEPVRPLREGPWLAHRAANKQGGTMYESEAVIQRDWPEGITDYACAYEGCGYNSVRPRSVASHYGQKHTAAGETEAAGASKVVPVTDYTEPLTSRDYVPSDRLVKALAAYLTENEVGAYGMESLARAALVWAHERPDLPDAEASPREPLSAEQIVERVRMLVGAPLAAVLEEVRIELGSSETERQYLMDANVELRQQLEDLRAERRALRDLLAEEGS